MKYIQSLSRPIKFGKIFLLLSTIMAVLLAFSASAATPDFKEVEFDWNSPSVIWEKANGYFPCKEAFYVKVKNCPIGTSSVTVTIYDSDGPDRTAVVSNGHKGIVSQSEAVAVGTGGVFTAFISEPLSFLRFYFIDVKLVTTIEAPATSTGAPLTTSITSIPKAVGTTQVYTITKKVTTPAAVATATGPITTTQVTTVTTETKTAPTPIFTIPLRSETSTLQFLGSIGPVSFGQSRQQYPDYSLAFVTGVKLKLRPISTNPSVGRFGLYPRASRCAFVVGTLVNDIHYKTTDITPAFVGLRPVVGFDVEFGDKGNVGLTIGAVFGRQDTYSKLTSSQNLVAGILANLSFSLDVFEALRSNTPDNKNFPSTPGTKNEK